MKAPIKVGQSVQHERFGIGVATRSDEMRTTIDFYEHGVKTFVTDMLQVELISDAPPRPPKPKAEKKSKRA